MMGYSNYKKQRSRVTKDREVAKMETLDQEEVISRVTLRRGFYRQSSNITLLKMLNGSNINKSS